MKTKLCRPVFILSNPNDETAKGVFNIKDRNWYNIYLISLDPNEKIDVGDMFVFINKHPQSDGKPRLDKCLDIFKNGNIQPYQDGYLCSREWKREYCHKVIAAQSQLSPEYIQQFIDEYNKGDVKDVEIEMEEIDSKEYHNEIDYKGYSNIELEYRPKLINNFITIVEKESIIYTEEEVWKLLKSLAEESSNGFLNNYFLKNWFEQNKKK